MMMCILFSLLLCMPSFFYDHNLAHIVIFKLKFKLATKTKYTNMMYRPGGTCRRASIVMYSITRRSRDALWYRLLSACEVFISEVFSLLFIFP
uniref:Secreted protein n=1 Tax=Aegilops tauschii subsp. strangulata TaxID=200361 RepID=A0A453KRH9_AEGTS